MRPVCHDDLDIRTAVGRLLHRDPTFGITIDDPHSFGNERPRARCPPKLPNIVGSVTATADDDDRAVALRSSQRKHDGTQRRCLPPSTTTASPVT